jgi:predicted dinucleotide-binding enzyme
MKIGIIGTGNIGATLTQRLGATGHQVKVANSRGPETIPAELTAAGGQAVHARDVVADVDALIVSIPLSRIPDIRPLIAELPDGVVLLDDGQVESLWVTQQLGRPVVKAWNAILADSFATKAAPAGTADRIAIPVAADVEDDRALGISLVEDTGFDGLDAGALADSWRQQPGTPAYCTDLTRDELQAALAAVVPGRAPRRRDLATTVISELMAAPTFDRGADFLIRVNRLLYS